MSGTLSPSPWFTGLDDNGKIIPGGKLFTYDAGTTTKVTTWTDADLSVPHTNPIILDAAGRTTIYLQQGQNYKFVLSPANDTDPPTNPIRTQDNIQTVPSSASNQDILGTLGESVLIGQVLYLSDGTGSRTAGAWYLADASVVAYSTGAELGFALAAGSSGDVISIRRGGTIALSGPLVVGAKYYVSAATPGDITNVAPANLAYVGSAESPTVLVISLVSPLGDIIQEVTALVDQRVKTLCNGRLTLTTGVPVTTTNVTAATTIFWTPYQGNEVALYNGSEWVTFALAQLSIQVPATTNTLYDVFIDYNAGAPQLALVAWTNNTTRATALTTQDGVLVLTGAIDHRYVGTFRTTGVSGETEDSTTKRYVWNYYHRVSRALTRLETGADWNYTTATIRQANANPANQVETVVGVQEVTLDLRVMIGVGSASAAVTVAAGIGLDSTSSFMQPQSGVVQNTTGVNTFILQSSLTIVAPLGYHFYSWNEYSAATGTTSWRPGPSLLAGTASGITGSIQG